jgi:hypothetical protein
MAKQSKPCLRFEKSKGAVLVIGSRIYEGRDDWHDWQPEGLGLDMLAGPGVDIVHNLENETPGELVCAFGHIECISVLEHTQRPWIVAAHLEEMLKHGGSIYISVPFVWRYHAYPGDLWRITHEALPVLFPGIDWQQIKYKSKSGLHDSAPIKYINTAERTLTQCEVVAFGVKC